MNFPKDMFMFYIGLKKRKIKTPDIKETERRVTTLDKKVYDSHTGVTNIR